jgi:hypothetical protein
MQLGKRKDGSQWMRIKSSGIDGHRSSTTRSTTLLALMRLSESDVIYNAASEVETKLKIC